MDDSKLPLGEICKEINTALKVEVCVPGEMDSLSDIKIWCPTMLNLLNLYLYGGIPIGRIWEIFGENHHGKTALALELMISVQRAGGISVYLDAEGTFSRKRALTMGHDPSRHIHMQADTVELGYRTIAKILESIRVKHELTCPILFVWDTIAASQTETEKKNVKYGEGMMNKPRLIREGLRSLSLELPRQNAGLVFVNQTIATMDTFGPGFDTPGGGSIKFWSTYRIHIRKAGMFQAEGYDNGIYSSLKMTKCKLGPPLRMIKLPLTYTHGWDNDYANFDFLVRKEATDTAKMFVERRGSYYYILGFGAGEIALYHSQLKKKMDQLPGLREYLIEGVKAEWGASYVV